MKRTIDFSVCVAIEVILASLIVFFTVLQKGLIVSSLLALSFVVIFAFALLNFSKWKYGAFVMLFVFLCMFNITFNGLIENGRFSFDYFKKAIMFASFFVFMNASGRETFTVSDKTLRLIKILPVIGGAFLAFSYLFLGNTNTVATAITLGFGNSNFAGMWVLHFFLFGCLFVMEGVKGSKLRLLYIPVLVQLLKMLNLTKARSCYIGLVVFFCMFILGIWDKKANKGVLLSIAISPLMIAIVYLCIVNASWFLNAFGFAISEGKSLTSRVGIWTYALEKFGEHFITGNYSGISMGYGQSQMHNTHIDVLCSYGILAAIMFVNNLYQNMVAVQKKANSLYQYMALCAFCGVIITGAFEAAIVSGAMGLNVLTIAFLILAKCDNKSKYINQESDKQ